MGKIYIFDMNFDQDVELFFKGKSYPFGFKVKISGKTKKEIAEKVLCHIIPNINIEKKFDTHYYRECKQIINKLKAYLTEYSFWDDKEPMYFYEGGNRYIEFSVFIEDTIPFLEDILEDGLDG